MRGLIAIVGWLLVSAGVGLFDHRAGMIAGGLILLGGVGRGYRRP